MKKQQQSIPIVQQDLSHEETIIQIAFSLEALEKVVSNIFTNVECAIERKKKRLHNIQKRCEVAKQKVEKLANINKSIKVFSCYKYPGPRTELFHHDPLHRIVEINEPNIKLKCSALPIDKFSLKEKLKFYHVRDSTLALKKNCETSSLEGLGMLPISCSKINSLLLYNTNQNIYKNYKIIDPLGNIVKQLDTSVNNCKSKDTEPGPISLGTSDPLSYKNIHNYFYSPSVQDVPDIDAPLNLPRLTGIAGDLRYNADQHIRNVEFEDTAVLTDKTSKLQEEFPVKDDEEISFVSESPQPPPPLPPPLPPLLTFDTKLETEQPLQKKSETIISSDVRANLMEAIRQAGGKSKLKHVSYDKPDPNIPQSKSLMDDLHEKLHMRRKGISGKIDNTDGMLDRIVSMIPPPPAPFKHSEEDDDEDWDD